MKIIREYPCRNCTFDDGKNCRQICENYNLFLNYRACVDEFVDWAYLHGVDFSFVGKIKEDGTSNIPERLEEIKKKFYEGKKSTILDEYIWQFRD